MNNTNYLLVEVNPKDNRLNKTILKNKKLETVQHWKEKLGDKNLVIIKEVKQKNKMLGLPVWVITDVL